MRIVATGAGGDLRFRHGNPATYGAGERRCGGWYTSGGKEITPALAILTQRRDKLPSAMLCRRFRWIISMIAAYPAAFQ